MYGTKPVAQFNRETAAKDYSDVLGRVVDSGSLSDSDITTLIGASRILGRYDPAVIREDLEAIRRSRSQSAGDGPQGNNP